MGVQFFGEFLVDRWVITHEQLTEGLELQEFRNLKFGQMAVERGKLTVEQAEKVHKLQRIQDLYYADLAVSENFMTKQQAQQILDYQRNNHLCIGEALLELGYLTDDILDRELTIYGDDQELKFPDNTYDCNPSGWWSFIQVGVEMTEKMLLRLVGPSVKIGQGISSRSQHKLTDQMDPFFSVVVSFQGDLIGDYVLSVPLAEAKLIASSILKQNVSGITIVRVEDALKFLCTMVCDHTISKLIEDGMKVEMVSPITLPSVPKAPVGTSMVRFPIRLSHGVLDLLFMACGAKDS